MTPLVVGSPATQEGAAALIAAMPTAYQGWNVALIFLTMAQTIDYLNSEILALKERIVVLEGG